MYRGTAHRWSTILVTWSCIFLAVAARADHEAPFHIQAHRGAGIAAPENTLPSFLRSWEMGVTPEADLRTTRDGIIVCFHDADFRRVVSNIGAGKKDESIETSSFEDVRKLEVGAFRGEQYQGERVPALADVFAVMRGRPERLLYLDIKTADSASLVDLIREYGVQSQVIFTTTHHQLIRDWKRRLPESLTLLWNGGSEEKLGTKLEAVRKVDFEGITHLQIHVRIGDLNSDEPFRPSTAFLQSVGQELQQRGIVFQVLPWKCSDQRAYVRLLELGAQSFATDYPETTLQAVRQFRRQNADQ